MTGARPFSVAARWRSNVILRVGARPSASNSAHMHLHVIAERGPPVAHVMLEWLPPSDTGCISSEVAAGDPLAETHGHGSG